MGRKYRAFIFIISATFALKLIFSFIPSDRGGRFPQVNTRICFLSKGTNNWEEMFACGKKALFSQIDLYGLILLHGISDVLSGRLLEKREKLLDSCKKKPKRPISVYVKGIGRYKEALIKERIKVCP